MEKTEQQESTLGIVNKTAKQKSNSKQLVEYFPVDDTPFTVARNDQEWFVLMGKYRFTEALKTKKDAMRNARAITWTRILQVIQVMLEDNNNELKKQLEYYKSNAEGDSYEEHEAFKKRNGI